jgi:dihydrofolate reductase
MNRKETVMRDLIVSEFMTLDGVVQAPAYPDEDESGGFAHGGWHTGYLDEAAMNWTSGNVSSAGGFLLGRRTYESFAAHWPEAGEEEQALAQPLNTKPKYVVSRTLAEPLEWQNSSLLGDEVVEAVRALRREDGDPVYVLGSTELAQKLLQEGLVDQLRLMIDPILVGGGKRIFPDDGVRRALRLVDSQVTSTGALLATYVPAPD